MGDASQAALFTAIAAVIVSLGGPLAAAFADRIRRKPEATPTEDHDGPLTITDVMLSLGAAEAARMAAESQARQLEQDLRDARRELDWYRRREEQR